MGIKVVRRAGIPSLALFAATAICSVASADNFDRRWGASVDIGGQAGNRRSAGEVSLFAPLWQNNSSLLFADIRGMFDDTHAREGNFGVGFRHMLENGWNVGAYGYLDIRRSSLNNTFRQASFGVEALSENFDIRANAYLPFSSIEHLRVLSSSAETTSSTQAVLTGDQLAIVTSSETTITSATLTEKAMRGFDAEVGVRLPVIPENFGMELRAFAGGFHFEADGMRNITGPRGRLELTARDIAGLPGVRATAGLTYQDDSVRGEQWIASARLTIPLDAQSKHRARNPLSYMESRMTDAVVRDVDIVSGQLAGISTTTEETSRVEEAAINTWNNQVVTSVTNVDARRDGYTALQTELDAAGVGGVVVLNGDMKGVSNIVTVNQGQTLLGGGTALKVRGANSGIELDYIAAGAEGTISGEGNNLSWEEPTDKETRHLVRMSGESVVGGLGITQTGEKPEELYYQSAVITSGNGSVLFGNEILGGQGNYSHGVVAVNSNNFVFAGNTIDSRNAHSTFAVSIFGSQDGEIYGNRLNSDNSGHGGLIFEDSNGIVLVSHNVIGGENRAIYILSEPEILAGSTGNILAEGFSGTQCSTSPASGKIEFVNAPDC